VKIFLWGFPENQSLLLDINNYIAYHLVLDEYGYMENE